MKWKIELKVTDYAVDADSAAAVRFNRAVIRNSPALRARANAALLGRPAM